MNAFFLILLGLVMPFSTALGSLLAGVIVLLWFVSGDHRQDFSALRGNPIIISLAVFFLLQVVGLIWTEDMSSGLHIVAKHWLLLLVPIFMATMRHRHVKYYLMAFVIAMVIQVAISILMWLLVIPVGHMGSLGDPVPFMGRISYNPYLAVAIYIVLYWAVLDDSMGKWQKYGCFLVAALMMFDMFITQGRAGQVMFFVGLFLIVFQLFEKSVFKASLLAMFFVALMFVMGYKASSTFKDRVDSAVAGIENFQESKKSSSGERLNYAVNSWELFLAHPLIGVGTGDFTVEYAKVNARNSPEMPYSTNPHNMYAREMVQFGVLGVGALLWILFAQLSFAWGSNDPLQRRMGMAIPIMYAVIMLSDSYLLGHFTTLLFVYLSSFVYKDWGAWCKPVKENGSLQ